MRTPRKPAKPRKSVRKSTPKEKPIKPIKVKDEGDWKETMPHGNRKPNGFCMACLDLETCVKQKLAMIITCDDKRV